MIMFIRKKLILLSLFFANGICIYNFVTSQSGSSVELESFNSNSIKEWKERERIRSKIDVEEQANNQKEQKKQNASSNKRANHPHVATNRECPIRWNNNQNAGSNQKPMINLDPNRFLAVVPTNGPNNQLIGARESIFVAIRLNRTVVIPIFFKHRSDDQISNGSYIHPGHRIDLAFLRRLVPVVTLDYFRDTCHGRMDAVFRVRKITTPKYRGLEEKLNMTLLKRDEVTGRVVKDNLASNVKEYPSGVQMQKKLKYFSIFPEKKAVEKLYPGKGKCAVLPSAFRNLKVNTKAPQGKAPTKIDVRNLSSLDLYSEIIRHTRAPRHIVAMTEDFISHVIGGRPYLAVHWRFDREDWMRRCLADEPWGSTGRLELCRKVQSFQPIDIANVISDKIRNISKDNRVDDVYIAYPLVDKDVIQETAKLLKNKFKLNVFTHVDVMTFWKNKYSSCAWLWSDRDDILSNTEMEICGNAQSFVRSTQSTWSSMVVLRREEDPNIVEDGDKKGISYYITIEQNKNKTKQKD